MGRYLNVDSNLSLQQRAYKLIKNDPDLIVQPPRNILEFSNAEWREL